MNPLNKLTYGLFLLSANYEGRHNGCIINTAMQVADNPEKLVISVNKNNLTHDMIAKSGEFCISSITESAPFELFKDFGMQSGRDVDKFKDFKAGALTEYNLYRLSEYSNMYLIGKVEDSLDLGSHTLFIANILKSELINDDPSCTYAYYHKAIKPSPKKAENKQWVCSVCGYVYEGEEIPDDFICPLCKHPKSDFVPNF